jgi:hypothetical protein
MHRCHEHGGVAAYEALEKLTGELMQRKRLRALEDRWCDVCRTNHRMLIVLSEPVLPSFLQRRRYDGGGPRLTATCLRSGDVLPLRPSPSLVATVRAS